jgi:hypothetical protein
MQGMQGMQRMRDVIVSDYQLRVCTTSPENIGRVSCFSIIEFKDLN